MQRFASKDMGQEFHAARQSESGQKSANLGLHRPDNLGPLARNECPLFPLHRTNLHNEFNKLALERKIK